jgi:hypothetical protein
MSDITEASDTVHDARENTEGETMDGTDDGTDAENDGLTTATGLVWQWLPTLVAAAFLGTFLLLVIAQSMTGVPVELTALPPKWEWTYLALVGGSGATTIGVDALSSWMDLRSK